MKNRSITSIIQNEYRDFSLYQVSKLTSVRDGLKPVTRRILQIARKYRSKGFLKVIELSGLVAPYHPHGDMSISGAIVTLGQGFVGYNNYPYIAPKGNYGTRLNGGDSAAARYIWAKLSDNAEKILMADEDIIPYVPTYDESRTEVEYFLPLIPTAILNPSEAIAVGFASKILPHDPIELIDNQIRHLKKQKMKNLLPSYDGFKGTVEMGEEGPICLGKVEVVDKHKVKITEVPIGYTHEKYINHLTKLEEKGFISSFKDYSKTEFDITITMPKMVKKYNMAKLIESLGMIRNLNPNYTFIDFDGDSVKHYEDPNEIISDFTNWRLQFFEDRYKNLLRVCDHALEYNLVLYKIITSDFPKKVQTMTRDKMKIFVRKFTKDQDIIEKVCGLPIYRFNKEEKKKLQDLLNQLKKDRKYYQDMIKSPTKRKNQYIKELEELSTWIGKAV